MKTLQPGDKIDRLIDNEIIYTMVVLRVSEDRAWADIPGGSEPYEFLRSCDGGRVTALSPQGEYVLRGQGH